MADIKRRVEEQGLGRAAKRRFIKSSERREDDFMNEVRMIL
jgi:hypothetical protein